MQEPKIEPEFPDSTSIIADLRSLFERLCDFRHPIRAAAFLIALFSASRLAYGALGLSFNSGTLDYFVQVADVALLRTDLIRTVLHLSTQAPLFNFAVGMVLKIFPAEFPIAFHVVYFLLGTVFTVSIYFLMVEMGVSAPLALVLASIHAVSPTTARYESWLFENYPMAVLFSLAGWALVRYLKRGSRWAGGLFFVLSAIIVLARANGYAFWMIFWVLATALARKSWREVSLLSSVPIAIVLAFALWQVRIFGTPNNSRYYTWGNIAARMAWRTTPEDAKDLLERHVISPTFFLFMYDPAEKIRPSIPNIPVTGIPVLDNDLKSNGKPNYFSNVYRYLGNADMVDVTTMLKLRPDSYVASLKGLLTAYAAPAGDQWAADSLNTPELRRISDFYDQLICGQFDPKGRAWFLSVAFPVLLLYGIARLVQIRDSVPVWTTLAFAVSNILIVGTASLAISIGDYNGGRFDVDVFYLLLFGLGATDAFHLLTRVDWKSIIRKYPVAITGHRDRPEKSRDISV